MRMCALFLTDVVPRPDSVSRVRRYITYLRAKVRRGTFPYLPEVLAMSRLARSGLSLVAVVVALVAIPVCAHYTWIAFAEEGPAAPTAGELQTALIRAGLDPEALATAGLSSQDAANVVGSFSSAMASEPGRLEKADADYAAARVESDALRRKIRSGLASAEEIKEFQSAKSALSSAEGDRADTLDDWFSDAVVGLSEAKVDALTTLRENRHWKLPIEFLVIDRTEQEWVSVREALNNERISAKYGDPADATHQADLSTWRSDAACSAAKANSDANSASIKAAWTSATGG